MAALGMAVCIGDGEVVKLGQRSGRAYAAADLSLLAAAATQAMSLRQHRDGVECIPIEMQAMTELLLAGAVTATCRTNWHCVLQWGSASGSHC
jgi:hypothetical protein